MFAQLSPFFFGQITSSKYRYFFDLQLMGTTIAHHCQMVREQ